jgi:hypothetical protein
MISVHLRPRAFARFNRALNRAKDKIAHYSPQRSHTAERLVVKSRGEVLFLKVADIDWIEAVGYYACPHVGSDTHIMRRTLLELERDPGESAFMRIPRSIIVNLDRIHRLELQNGGEYEAVLKLDARLRLSRRFRKQLQDRMDPCREAYSGSGAPRANSLTTAANIGPFPYTSPSILSSKYLDRSSAVRAERRNLRHACRSCQTTAISQTQYVPRCVLLMSKREKSVSAERLA